MKNLNFMFATKSNFAYKLQINYIMNAYIFSFIYTFAFQYIYLCTHTLTHSAFDHHHHCIMCMHVFNLTFLVYM